MGCCLGVWVDVSIWLVWNFSGSSACFAGDTGATIMMSGAIACWAPLHPGAESIWRAIARAIIRRYFVRKTSFVTSGTKVVSISFSEEHINHHLS